MAHQKRDWFQTGESEDEDVGYDSERAEFKGKTSAFVSSKRRKLSSDVSVDSGDNVSNNDGAESSFVTAQESGSEDEVQFDEDASAPTSIEPATRLKTAKTRKDSSKAATKLAKMNTKGKKTGVLYISRIPPFMKPPTLRHLLTPYAASGLDRIFLTPEDPETHKARVKSGGNKKKSFLDGWVEFVSKKEAKIVAEELNGKNIGGRKGNYYYDDAWNLKYLHGFKWRHLTEQIANENAEKESKLRAEAAKERKEARDFVHNVEHAKILNSIAKKAEKRSDNSNADPAETGSKENHIRNKSNGALGKPVMFRQSKVVPKHNNHTQNDRPSAETQRVLSKIF